MKFLDLSIKALIQSKMTEFYSGIFSAYEFYLRKFCFEKKHCKDFPRYLNTFICKFHMPQDRMTFTVFSYAAPITYCRIRGAIENCKNVEAGSNSFLEGVAHNFHLWRRRIYKNKLIQCGR